MKLATRLLGLSVFFAALTPTAFARSIDDFAFPSSASSASSAMSSSASSQDSSVPSTLYVSPSSASSSSKAVDFWVKVRPLPPETPEARQTRESALPETRAGFVSMIVHRLYNNVTIDTCFWNIASELPPSFTLVFTDVPTTHPYAKEICVAMNNGIIKGYGDGSFHPDGAVSFADASKMLSRAYGLSPWADATVSEPWFDQYVETLDQRGAIPSSVRSFDQRMTRADVAEILDRLDGHVTTRPVTTLSSLRQDWTKRFAAPVRRVTVPAVRRPTPAAAAATSSQASSSKAPVYTLPTASSSAAAQGSSAKSYPAWSY